MAPYPYQKSTPATKVYLDFTNQTFLKSEI